MDCFGKRLGFDRFVACSDRSWLLEVTGNIVSVTVGTVDFPDFAQSVARCIRLVVAEEFGAMVCIVQ